MTVQTAIGLMGIPVDDVPYIRYAEQWGAGTTSFSPEDIVTLNQPREAEGYPAPTGLAARLTRSVHQDRACSACFASLVHILRALEG